jgi:hypothetical protein
MKLTREQIKELKTMITLALTHLYRNDESLIERETHERSIAFRFGLYFDALLRLSCFSKMEGMYIDFDYNRNGYDSKELGGSNIYPDIILHHRGDNQRNLLVIEFKTYWNTDTSGDIEKLERITSNEYHYKFGLGASIILTQTLEGTLNSIKYFKSGSLQL